MKRYNRCLFYCYKNFWINFFSILIVIVVGFILYVACFIKFDFCDRYSGLVLRKEDYYVSILVDNNWFNVQNYSLLVNKEKKDYSVVSISSDYTITESGLKKEVVLKFDIDTDDRIVNNVLNLYFIRKMTFFSKIKEMIL